MKLSENFVEVLKNFASINTGLVVKPGSCLRTISQNKAILAQAEVDEVFESEFGIYDLNKTLGIISMDKANPEVTVGEEALLYGAGKRKITQRFTDINLIMAPPAKNINVKEYNVSFELTKENFDWIFEVSSILKCPNIVVSSEGDDGVISINAVDVKGEIVDSAKIELDATSAKAFKAVFKIDNIKVIPGEYTVEIAAAGVSRFTSATRRLTYWVAIEAATSSFSK